LKPLFVLLVFVLPYTMMCYLWWFTYSWRQIYSADGEACTNVDKIMGNAPYEDYKQFQTTWQADSESLANVALQGQFMRRWPVVFLVFFLAFMIPCIPFSSLFCYRRVNRKWRRYQKDKRRAARRQEKAVERRQKREEEKAAKALAAQDDLELDKGHDSDDEEVVQPAKFGTA